MDEEFIRNRITELRLKKGVSEYQMSMELGQNRSYIQAISSGRSMPSMKQFLNICEYFEITPLQFFDTSYVLCYNFIIQPLYALLFALFLLYMRNQGSYQG